MGNKMDTGRQELQRFDTFVPIRIEDFPESIVPRNVDAFIITRTQTPSFTAIRNAYCGMSYGLALTTRLWVVVLIALRTDDGWKFAGSTHLYNDEGFR